MFTCCVINSRVVSQRSVDGGFSRYLGDTLAQKMLYER